MRDLRFGELAQLARSLVTGNRFLRRTPRWSRDQMLDWQLQRLRQLVSHAWHNVPFYRSLYAPQSFEPGDLKSWEDFHRLPIVTKDQVIENYPERMLAAGVDRDRLIFSRSSGSSGKVLDIAYGGQALTTYILAGLRLYRMAFRYRPWHRQLYVYTSPYPMQSLFGLYPLHFVPTLSPIHDVVVALKQVRPHLLVCYPSHLKEVARELTRQDLRHVPLRAVSVNSEMSTQAERDSLAEFFGCPVLDEYSSEELTRIAGQCLSRTYHVFEDINFLETVDEFGQPTDGAGILVGTNLHNFAMPMIRYQQNDLGALADVACPCGWRFRALQDLQGRRNDSFVLPSGKVMTSGFLLDATYEFLLCYRDAVRDFCLIQRTRDLIELEVVPGVAWGQPIAEKIRARFEQFLEPGVTFQVAEVQQCHKTKTGKRNPIINLVGRSSEKSTGERDPVKA